MAWSSTADSKDAESFFASKVIKPRMLKFQLQGVISPLIVLLLNCFTSVHYELGYNNSAMNILILYIILLLFLYGFVF